MSLDRLIAGARVFDGRNFRDRVQVGLSGDTIAYVGQEMPPAETVTVAKGFILAPAFIDSHNHADFHVADPTNDGASSLAQGVGALVTGNCGMSATPEGEPDPVLQAPAGAACASLEEHARCRRGGLSLDVSDLMGHGTLRRSVLGSARSATDKEIDRMAAILSDFIAAGGVGMSVGLNYAEAAGTTESELLALCRVLGRTGRPLACHLRDYGDGLLRAVDEVWSLGERAGCPVLLSHLRPVPARCAPLLSAVLERVETRDGLYMDVYPYTAGCTSLAWFIQETFGRLPGPGETLPADEAERRIADLCEGGFSDLRILKHRRRDYVGRSVADLAGSAGERPGKVAQSVLAEDPSCLCLYERVALPSSVDQVLLHPKSFLGSDGWLFPTRHAEPCHPRSYAAVTRFLTRYVRDGRIAPNLGLAKLTSGPARFFGLSALGEIREGARANLCLFDWKDLEERADFDRPTLSSGGMAEVVVGGRTAWRASVGAVLQGSGRRVSP